MYNGDSRICMRMATMFHLNKINKIYEYVCMCFDDIGGYRVPLLGASVELLNQNVWDETKLT